ncbi:MAG: hypothetical protein AAF191_03835 [Verrucomicrobiota bacterium]
MHLFRPQPAPPPIALADSTWPKETWKAVDIALAGMVPDSPLYFRPENEVWAKWCASSFATLLVPHLLACRGACRKGMREVRELDLAFTATLSSSQREASSSLGKEMIGASQGARHLSDLAKLNSWVETGVMSGQAATILAVRSFHFHIPAAQTIFAALFCDWLAASPTHREGETEDRQRIFQEANTGLAKQLQIWLQAEANNRFPTGPV